MEINYIRIGDYFLPAITLSDPPGAPSLGYYGMRRKEYLREYRSIVYSQLLLSERLYEVCRDMDLAAESRLRAIADKEQAHEIILTELVYN